MFSKMAYHIETDLRSVVYRHLTRLSFSFSDRIQSGQVISRASSAPRSRSPNATAGTRCDHPDDR